MVGRSIVESSGYVLGITFTTVCGHTSMYGPPGPHFADADSDSDIIENYDDTQASLSIILVVLAQGFQMPSHTEQREAGARVPGRTPSWLATAWPRGGGPGRL